ncbi:MAG TPA: Hsp20/alpha crystallin family protein [Bacteroidetes bacterium]|nr:Hsp20/alpha crystallin family protein [Bacteroidota bacterium]HIL57802.1 Hsp20/alpha crystallin family protein [Rhodothermales bacterium]
MNTLIRRGPAREFDLLRREMDRLFDSFGDTRDSAPSVWAPRTDIAETDDAYLLTLDLPGIPRDALDVTFEDGTLKVSGERQSVRETQEGRYHRVERSAGRFFRSFALGSDVDADGIDAELADGVLTLRVPKAETAQPRRIDVRAGMKELEMHEN